MSVSLQIVGSQAGWLCDASEHAGADLFAVVEGKDEVWPTFAYQHAVASATLFTDHPMRKSAARTRLALVEGQELMRR